jgi:peptidoglycan/LPS O-acetylase OafA/YrhL
VLVAERGTDGSERVAGPVTRTRTSARPAPRRAAAFRLTHIPALDGLRGVAVLVVVLFHAGHLDGGYLGVDLFFTLSGFLITTLLLEERRDTGTIRFKAFWLRRARRLLPALFAMLAFVLVYAAFFADPTELGRIRADALGTVFYVANWRTIIAGQGYWDLFGSPSPLQHTWSLAIEEQFYLVWPLLLGGLLWLTRGSRRAVFLMSVGLAFAGAIWMAIVFDPLDTNRAYLGTDTRIPALLLGAALAAWLQWHGPVRGRRARIGVEVAAVVGLEGLVLAWITLPGGSALLYRGGLFLCGLAAVAVLASITHPSPGPVARVLSVRPLRGLGIISYGLYLWHWPIIVLVDQDRTGLSGWSLTAVQLAISVSVAVASYFLLELPIRRRGLAALPWRPLAPILVASVVIGLLFVTRDARDASQSTAVSLDALPVQTDAPIGQQQPDVRRQPGPLPRPLDRWPRLMVVGDSVGGSLGGPMESNQATYQVQAVNRAIPACTLDRDSGRTLSTTGAPRQEAPACQQWPQRWADDISRFNPDAVLMIFGGLNGEPRLVDGSFHGMCEQVTLDWYRKELDDALTLLASKGAVVFVTPFAYSETTDRPDADATADCLNPVVRAAVAANPDARLIPLDTYVCSAPNHCKTTVDGVKLRWDGLHYRDHAADVMDQWLLGQIFQPATGPPTTETTPAAPTTLSPLPPAVMATVAPSPTTTRPTSPSRSPSTTSPRRSG